MQEIDIPRNTASDIIIYCLNGLFTVTIENEQYLRENNAQGNYGKRSHRILKT
jgi:hypothetical protein